MGLTRTGLTACCLAALLTGCGGDSGNGPAPSSAPAPVATPAPSPTPSPSAHCSLRARQEWASAQLQEWYLFPDLLAAGLDPAAYSTVEDYIDALVQPARALGRDRYFTYLTSIAEENAYYEQGANAGFGFRLSYDTGTSRVFVSEAFEGAPALAAGIDRGAELLEIQSVSVASLMASGGPQAVINALGTSVVVIFRDTTGVDRVAALNKREYTLDPVSDRYGAKVIRDGGRSVGYLNLRTFIDTAEPVLRAAFASFKAQGVTELIVDLRYNGGGLISTAELMGNLLADGRGGQVFERIAYRDSKASENETYAFQVQPESIAPTRIAFIGTGSTASASELVINGFIPYLGTSMALVGSNTYGKPVGQIALDRPACDDRLRVVALKIENAAGQGEYYNGLATAVPVTCAANDDLSRQLGDPAEAMIRASLDFLAGRSCTAISARAGASAAGAGTRVGTAPQPEMLVPEKPRSTLEREVPGGY
ncbi:MAG: peptidase S41 [Porphyrobacter sp.]|nr:peptidase S41 [Porphyrobacter sp.]